MCIYSTSKFYTMKTFLEKTTDFRTSSSYKFYVPTVFGAQDLALQNNGFISMPQPDLLSGEIVIKEAHQVVLFSTTTDQKRGFVGNLFVTNFRIFLVPTDGAKEREATKQRNRLIGEYSVCLTNVDSIHQMIGNKTRKLFPSTNVTGRIKILQIVCKNMKVLTLSFEQSPHDHGKNVAKTILHHAFPGRHALLFAYEFSEPDTSEDKAPEVVKFSCHQDWASEVHRTCRNSSSAWRVSSVNRNFAVSIFLPEWIVVPKSIVDGDVVEISRAFRCDRPPTWAWSHSNGAALVRMADCLPAITVRTQENKFMENLRALHPNKKPPIMIELDKVLPSVRDIQASYLKLREICAPESKRLYDSQDSRFHQLLESSKWLNYVSMCLREAVTAAEHLRAGIAVVIQEGDGRDTSAIVASLVQLMLDASSRTITGFQSLIQKEWVAMGHPFCSRLGLIRNAGNEQSPIFLLFLDCVWQLQRQFITAFEFSETYLTSLFDSCFVSIFDTFLFDCERERINAMEQEHLKLRSVWNWKKQFDDGDISFFKSPLYQLDDIMHPRSPKISTCNILPKSEVYFLEPWSQCYYRWLPPLGIRRGGNSQAHLIHRWLRSSIDKSLCEIKELTKRTPVEVAQTLSAHSLIPTLTVNSLADSEATLRNSLLAQSCLVDSYFPFSNCDDFTDSLVGDISNLSEFDSQSVLNLTD